jgi:hypothetical protein
VYSISSMKQSAWQRFKRRVVCFFKGHDPSTHLTWTVPVGKIPARRTIEVRCTRCFKKLEEYGDEREC